MEGGDNKIDAIRHMYWQALLCNNYGGSLEARLDFAKRVGDLYEEYGDNNSDSMAMDYHNNRVGRQVVYRENARTYKEWCCFGYEWWVSYIGVHHIDSAVLLQRAKDLAKKENKIRINVEEQIKEKSEIEGVKLYPDYLNNSFYHAEKVCNRTYWIENNAWKYINKPIILAENPPTTVEEYYKKR